MAGTSRNLIVLSDGTGNSASSPFKTNVWRLYQALDLKDGKQVAVFGDGVGTSSIKILRVIGLALGVGVKRNVINLYKFLCHNYRPGDRIWAFGFSRGAFTIRVLVGLIHSQGLVSFDTEAELQQNAVAAYRAYRKDVFWTKIPWVWVGRHIRDGLIWFWRALTGGKQYTQVQEETEKTGRRQIPIHFVGVWDTVVAYGLPIDELTIAVDKWVWPMKFRDTSLLESVQHARHALSLDDERRTFHPVPWDERAEKKIQEDQEKNGQKRAVPANRLLQVWFPGMHADVGGGYPDDGLSFVPLCWMIDEAAAVDAGEDKRLRFEENIVYTYRALGSPTGRLYDSRAGFGALWRYQPRNVQFLMDNNKDDVPAEDMVTPVVHHCMVTRMIYGNDSYAPISLPLEIDIFLPDRSRVAFDSAAVDAKLQETKTKLATATEKTRPGLERTETVLTDLSNVVRASTDLPRADYFALVLDTIWYRRIIYFVTLVLALAALVYPAVYEFLDWGNKIEKVNDFLGSPGLQRDEASDTSFLETIANGLFEWVAGLVQAFVPSFAIPWIDAITRSGLTAILIALFFLLSLALSSFLQGRIHDRGRAAWNIQRRINGHDIEHLKPTGQRHALLTLSAIFSILALFTYPTYKADPNNGFIYWAHRVFVALAVFNAVVWIYRMIKPPKKVDPSHPKFVLRFARALRTSRWWVRRYRWVAQNLAPFAFIVAVAYLAFAGLNLAAFNIQSTIGRYCEAPKKLYTAQKSTKQGTRDEAEKKLRVEATQEEKIDGEATIDIKSLCASTGLRLVAGRQYRIRIETQQDWFDKGTPADVSGFSSDGLRHAVATPLRRWWRENWFQPIARVGRYGDYEYPLRPAAPLAEADFSACEPEPPGFWTGLGQALLGFSEMLIHPVDAIRDIPSPASPEAMAKHLACEKNYEIRRAKVLISDITPRTTGALYIYVNDAILFWPGKQNLFYLDNTGSAKVTVTRTVAPATIDSQMVEGGPMQQRN